MNGDGVLDLAMGCAAGGPLESAVLLGNGDGTFINDWYGQVRMLLGRSSTSLLSLSSQRLGIMGVSDFSLLDRKGALETLDLMRRRHTSLSLARGTLGAGQSRMESAANLLRTAAVSSDEAVSRIRDADIALETSKLLAEKIRTSSAAAVLGMSNMESALALDLLQIGR